MVSSSDSTFRWHSARWRRQSPPASSCRTRSFASRPTTPSRCCRKHIEFGQGPYTGIATILADELDADWSQMRAVSAPADASKYNNFAFGPVQGTGGSTAMANSWDQLRAAGAEARARLIAAAAKEWGVDAGFLTIEKGVVKGPDGKSATFGELAGLAQQIELPGPFKPKDPSAWKLIGLNKLPKVDTLPKTNGTAIYTIDVKMQNMLTCLVARPSRFHAKVQVLRSGAGARRAGRQGSVRRLAGRCRSRRRLLGGKERSRCAEGRPGTRPAPKRAAATRSSKSTSTSPTSRASSPAMTATPTRRCPAPPRCSRRRTCSRIWRTRRWSRTTASSIAPTMVASR